MCDIFDSNLPVCAAAAQIEHTCQKFKNTHRAIYIPNFALK